MSAMEKIRTRAAAGEDFTQLQKEIYEQFHIQAAPAPISVTTIQRKNAPGDEAKAFNLKPGEVSPVLDLSGTVAILKLQSKETSPLTSVRSDIDALLRGERAQAQLGQIAGKVKTQFNLQYLELPSQPDLFGLGVSGPAEAPKQPPASNTNR
jgi:hypothetical protein